MRRRNPMALRRKVAKNIRKYAAEAELPLNRLADRANMARAYLYALLNAESAPTTDALTKLANALDVDVVDLLS